MRKHSENDPGSNEFPIKIPGGNFPHASTTDGEQTMGNYDSRSFYNKHLRTFH